MFPILLIQGGEAWTTEKADMKTAAAFDITACREMLENRLERWQNRFSNSQRTRSEKLRRHLGQ